MFKRILIYLYVNFMGAIKIAKEQIFDRQRELNEKDLPDQTGRHIVICGNIQHSRVARSHLALLPRLGAVVHFVPDNDDPLDLTGPYTRHKRLQDILPNADAIMMLRVQKERMAVMPDLSRYLHDFGLKEEDARHLKSGALIMHPGPFNRNVEIASGLVDHPASVIQNQVAAGVAIRMAILAGV